MRQSMHFKFGPTLGAIFGLALCTIAEASSDAIYDGPAISVFPDHEKIGKSYPLKQAVSDGKRLFITKFNMADGAGRPFAVRLCSHSYACTSTSW
jgi:hypothetical protein